MIPCHKCNQWHEHVRKPVYQEPVYLPLAMLQAVKNTRGQLKFTEQDFLRSGGLTEIDCPNIEVRK